MIKSVATRREVHFTYEEMESNAFKAKLGDGRAAEQLLMQCEPMISSAIHRFGPLDMDPDDLAQDCRLLILEVLPDYEADKAQIGYYLRKRLEWYLKDLWKRRQEALTLDAPLVDEEGHETPMVETIPDESVNIEEDYITMESCYFWARQIADLTPRRMYVINAHIIEEKTLRKVAKELKITHRQAQNDKKMALRTLRNRDDF